MIKDPNSLSLQEICVRRDMGPIFGIAVFLGIWFDEEDIRYIKTKMMTDKKYRAVSGNIGGPKTNTMQVHKYRDIWLLGFLDDPEITTGVKAFIIYYTGHHRGDLKAGDEYCGTHRYDNFMHERFLAARWMETCMQTGHKKKYKKTKSGKKHHSKAVKHKIGVPSMHNIVMRERKTYDFITKIRAKGKNTCR